MASLAFGRHKVSTGSQAIVSRPEVPRSTFISRATHKTTFDADKLIPIYVEEVLPGDSLNLNMTAFVRMSTLVFPMMDNLYCDTFWFFVPNRLVWNNWEKFMGQQDAPGDSTDYLIPVVFATAPDPDGYTVTSLADYFGIPPKQQTQLGFYHSALPLRGYQLIYNEWFRDQNLQDPAIIPVGDGPDDQYVGGVPANGFTYPMRYRNKRHDYFTSALPFPQKGNPVQLPLSGSAPIVPIGNLIPTFTSTGGGTGNLAVPAGGGVQSVQVSGLSMGALEWADPKLEADLTDVLAVSVNTMRAAVATQQLLERDARFGTRYVESLKGHFGVDPQDYRLQRPEYLGGSSTPISVTPVAQTSATGATGTPLAGLAAAAVSTPRARISHTFPEHGYVFGIMNVRADLSYQQGLHRMWTKRTRYDFAYPVFANLGEQIVREDEIFLQGTEALNGAVFGYQERYAEYRFRHSLITGMFRSGIPGTLDSWHLAQYFGSGAPTLDVGGEFIRSDTPMERILAAGELADNQQFLADILFDQRFTRPLPLRGTPGLLRL